MSEKKTVLCLRKRDFYVGKIVITEIDNGEQKVTCEAKCVRCDDRGVYLSNIPNDKTGIFCPYEDVIGVKL